MTAKTAVIDYMEFNTNLIKTELCTLHHDVVNDIKKHIK